MQAIFEAFAAPEDTSSAARLPAGALIRRVEQDLMANVYRWTGHFPERTRSLLRYLAARAEQLQQVYPADREPAVLHRLEAAYAAWESEVLPPIPLDERYR